MIYQCVRGHVTPADAEPWERAEPGGPSWHGYFPTCRRVLEDCADVGCKMDHAPGAHMGRWCGAPVRPDVAAADRPQMSIALNLNVITALGAERAYQRARYGDAHDDELTPHEWTEILRAIILRHVKDDAAELTYRQIVMVGAVAIAALEALDRQTIGGGVMPIRTIEAIQQALARSQQEE